MKKLIVLLCTLVCIALNSPAAHALEAEEISGESLVESHGGIGSVSRLFDGRFMESVEVRSGGYLTLRHGSGIGSLYILLDQEDRGYTLTNEVTGDPYHGPVRISS